MGELFKVNLLKDFYVLKASPGQGFWSGGT